MFKINRRIVAGLVASAALAGAAAGPQGASAAGQCYWKAPSQMRIVQSNGWLVVTRAKTAKNTWTVKGMSRGGSMYGTLKLTRFDVSGYRPRVRFTVTWPNGSGGVYAGTIDQDGFVTGVSSDKFNPGSTADFHLEQTVDCV
jgi:hypothetical protein